MRNHGDRPTGVEGGGLTRSVVAKPFAQTMRGQKKRRRKHDEEGRREGFAGMKKGVRECQQGKRHRHRQKVERPAQEFGHEEDTGQKKGEGPGCHRFSVSAPRASRAWTEPFPCIIPVAFGATTPGVQPGALSGRIRGWGRPLVRWPRVPSLRFARQADRPMALYAIGDVHGCYDTLERLLERVRFDAGVDRLWFTGDLVNRGPKSLETLRFVAKLGEAATVVLGNHDLYVLALAAGIPRRRPEDNLVDRILEAPDGPRLLDWLRARPLLHHDPELGYTLVHAGLPPCWGLEDAQKAARAVEATLSGPDAQEFLRAMPSDEPRHPDRAHGSREEQIFTINALTRIRYWDPDKGLDFHEKGPPGSQPSPLLPWYDVPGRAGRDLHILFGHWSTVGDLPGHNVHPLDTGCYWGRSLTALRLDGDAPKRISIPCRPRDRGFARTAG